MAAKLNEDTAQVLRAFLNDPEDMRLLASARAFGEGICDGCGQDEIVFLFDIGQVCLLCLKVR